MNCIQLWSCDEVPHEIRSQVRALNERVEDDADFYAIVPGAAISDWFRGKPVFHNSWRATAALFKRIGEVVWFDLADGNALCVGRLW